MRAILGLLLVGGLIALAPIRAVGQGRLVGVKAGVNFATMGGSDLDVFETACSCNVSSRTAFAVGGFMSFQLGQVLRLQPELLYVGKGTAFDISGQALEIRTTYIEIPVLLVVAPRVQGTIHPSLFGGGAVAVKIGCSLAGGGSSTSCSNATFNVKSLDYGLILGAGLGYSVGRGELLLDARYNLGLADFIDENPTPALKYRGLALMAGYSFRIGR